MKEVIVALGSVVKMIGINLHPNTKRARGELNTLLYSFKDHKRSVINIIIYNDQVNIIFDHQSLPALLTSDHLLQFVNERVIPWIDSKLNSKRMLASSSWSKEEWEVISQCQIVAPNSTEQQNFASAEEPQDLVTSQTSNPSKRQELGISIEESETQMFWESNRVESNETNITEKQIVDLTL